MEKIAFLFPGQGSHYVGMSRELYDQFTVVKKTFEEANDVLGIDLANLCFNGSLAELSMPRHAHPAIVASSVSCFRVYMQEVGIPPQFLAGHSLGEYSAFTCSGAIRFDEALKVVQYRGLLTEKMVESGIGLMSVIDGVPGNLVEEECRKREKAGGQVWISCYNTPNQTVISGETEIVEELEERFTDSGAVATPLISSAPFHSKLMQNIASKLEVLLANLKYGHFKYPVITNVDAQPLASAEKVADNLIKHLTHPVQWEGTVRYLKQTGVTLAVEMGAKKIITNMVHANVGHMEALCFGTKEEREKLIRMISGKPGLKKQVPTVISRCLAIAVATPNHNYDSLEYQEKVVKPYRKIQDIQNLLDDSGNKPTIAQMREALDLLLMILKTKKVSEEEQRRWIYQTVDETGTFYELGEYLQPA